MDAPLQPPTTYLDILSPIGSVASLISLGLTLYIALGIRNIRNNYIFRVRAPEFIRALTKHASTLISFGNDFNDSRQRIDVELATSDVTLRSMQGRMRGQSREAVDNLRALIRAYQQNPNNIDNFYPIYTGMQRVIQEIKELQRELDLE